MYTMPPQPGFPDPQPGSNEQAFGIPAQPAPQPVAVAATSNGPVESENNHLMELLDNAESKIGRLEHKVIHLRHNLPRSNLEQK